MHEYTDALGPLETSKGMNEVFDKASAKVGGVKHDQGKPRWDLLPWRPVEEIVKVYTMGAKKYSDWNWAKGMKWSRIWAATQRHMMAIQQGEWLDPESGLPHAAHAAWGFLTLMEYKRLGRGLDDLGDKAITLAESGQPE